MPIKVVWSPGIIGLYSSGKKRHSWDEVSEFPASQTTPIKSCKMSPPETHFLSIAFPRWVLIKAHALRIAHPPPILPPLSSPGPALLGCPGKMQGPLSWVLKPVRDGAISAQPWDLNIVPGGIQTRDAHVVFSGNMSYRHWHRASWAQR